MHCFHHFPALDARGNIGLVRDDYDQEAGFAQGQGCAFNSREKLKLIEGGRRIRLTVTHHSAIDNAIAIEEQGPASPITNYYQHWVITPDGFVFTAHGLQDYAETLRLKLQRELVKPIG